MSRAQKTCTLLMVCLVVLSAAAAWAAPAATFSESPRFQKWFDAYAKDNGDHSVALRLQPTRFFLTEKTDLRGFIELDLIDGDVVIELSGLDRQVDVWALDNARGTSILSGDEGDRLFHLARLSPADGDEVRFARDFGSEAFRGFELDWVFVSNAGTEPTESRLLYATRSYLERQFTKRRLASEGFDMSIPKPERIEAASADKSGLGIARRPHKALVTEGLVTEKQFFGADVFFRETFEGNGRSCGTCHPAENNQTIDGPDFLDSLPDSDPLFVAEQRPPYDPISQLEVPALMRGHGLIVENLDGLEDPTVKFVMRGVPHSLSLATSTSPDDGVRTGWSGDGAPAPGTIRMFLLGATIQHYPNVSLARIPGIDFRLPTEEELDLNVEFMLSVGRLNDIDLNGVSLKNAYAESGRDSFINSGCNFCHLNAGANAAAPPPPGTINRNFQTNVELLPNPAQITDPTPLNATEYPFDAGFGTTPTNCDPSDPETDGFGDCSFNTTPLIEAADTGPFFHNNTVETIEGAVAFYAGPPFPGAPIFPGDPVTQNNVAAFLRVMNATFNLQIAMQRNKAALHLSPAPSSGPLSPTDEAPDPHDPYGLPATVNKLLLLSIDECEDARRVLTDGPLGNLSPEAVYKIDRAIRLNKLAVDSTSRIIRYKAIYKALIELSEGNGSLGTGTGFIMGAGNLLF